MEIYAPLAQRLGISKIKIELDDLSLKYLHPDVYYDLVDKVALTKTKREEFVRDIVEDVKTHIEEAGIKGQIGGRVKHFFSIYKKMKNQNKTLDQIYDLFAVRVLVEDVKDCYAVLGILHEMYIPIPDARAFHENNPDFFGTNVGTFIGDTPELALEKGEREFNLIFEPSGDKIRAFITQDNGKAIESVEKQSYLGEWILRRIFQLPELEPLTAKRLNEIGINGIRLYKTDLNNDIHLQFIWIDQDSLPNDYVGD